MNEEFDFSKGKRGLIAPIGPGKTRITIRLDDDVLEWFRAQVHATGGGNYQSLINLVLREHIKKRNEPLEEILRRLLREEFLRSLSRETTKRTKVTLRKAKTLHKKAAQKVK